MTKLSLIFPELLEPSKTADPRTRTALKAIETVINGELDTENLKNEGIAEVDLNTALKALVNAKTSGLAIVGHTTNATAVSGELMSYTGTGPNTVTLPTPTLNRKVGIFNFLNGSALVTITASSGKIFGDFVESATSIVLGVHQHVELQADGSNWQITAGEPTGRSWGSVSEAGTKEAGSADFTVARTGEGIYEVKWNPTRASATYALVVTAQNPSRVANVSARSATAATIGIHNGSGANENCPFSFIALGP